MASIDTFPFYQEMQVKDGELDSIKCDFCDDRKATTFWAATHSIQVIQPVYRLTLRFIFGTLRVRGL